METSQKTDNPTVLSDPVDEEKQPVESIEEAVEASEVDSKIQEEEAKEEAKEEAEGGALTAAESRDARFDHLKQEVQPLIF